MARSLTIVVLCLCLTVAFAADLRRLIAERAAGVPQTPRAGADGKTGDLDTANSWGYGWGGPWGGYGGWGGFGGWGPWGYGWGGYPGFGYGGWW